MFELSSSGLDEFPPNWFEANFYPKTIQFELTMSIFGNNEKWKLKDIFQLYIEKNKEIKVSFILFYWLVKNPKKKNNNNNPKLKENGLLGFFSSFK